MMPLIPTIWQEEKKPQTSWVKRKWDWAVAFSLWRLIAFVALAGLIIFIWIKLHGQ